MATYPYSPNFEMATAAKILGFKHVGRNKLFETLRGKKILSRENIPYQRYIDYGYFEVELVPWGHPADGRMCYYKKTVVTPKGLEWLQKFLTELGYQKL